MVQPLWKKNIGSFLKSKHTLNIYDPAIDQHGLKSMSTENLHMLVHSSLIHNGQTGKQPNFIQILAYYMMQ